MDLPQVWAVNHRSRDRNTKVGYDYVHSLIDDYSRLAYSEVLPDERAPPAPGS